MFSRGGVGAVDAFLQSRIAPGLQPGEQVIGSAHVRRRIPRADGSGPTHGYDDWLVAATDRRLVMLKTSVVGDGIFSLMSKLTVQAACLDVAEWWYQDLRAVQQALPTGRERATLGPIKVVLLAPHQGMGATGGLDQELLVLGNTEGLDGQRRFFLEFPEWLQAQVAAGRFPMSPERQQLFLQRQHERAAHAADLVARKAGSQELLKKEARQAGPYLISLVPLLAGLLCGIALFNGIASHGQVEQNQRTYKRQVVAADVDLAAVRAGQLPPSNEQCQPWPAGMGLGGGTGLLVRDASGGSHRCGADSVYLERAEQARRHLARANEEDEAYPGNIIPFAIGLGVSLLVAAGVLVWAAMRGRRLARVAP